MIPSPGGKQFSSYNKNWCLECNNKKNNRKNNCKNNKNKNTGQHAFANETKHKPSPPPTMITTTTKRPRRRATKNMSYKP
eukprot:5723593-Ditylum_brightwellii.AAC.1